MKRLFFKFMTLMLGLLVTGCSRTPADEATAVNYQPQFEAFSMGILDCVPIRQDGNRFDEFADNPFVKVSEQPTSTFSVDADGASFALRSF